MQFPLRRTSKPNGQLLACYESFVGVARKGNAEAWRENGAQVVVPDLAEIVGPRA